MKKYLGVISFTLMRMVIQGNGFKKVYSTNRYIS